MKFETVGNKALYVLTFITSKFNEVDYILRSTEKHKKNKQKLPELYIL